jgi:hypothetical protein
MDRRQDPRTIVTPYAFSVHPDLLGLPLATPWQRLGALAIDGVIIIGLGRLGGITLAIASALLLFWLAIRKPGKDIVGKLFRFSVGCLGMVILAVTILVVVFLELADDPETQAVVREALDSRGVEVGLSGIAGTDSMSLSDLLILAPAVLDLNRTEDAEEARALVEEIAEEAREGGMPLREIRAGLEGLMPDDLPWSDQRQEMLDDAMASLGTGLPELEGNVSVTQAAITDSVALDSISTLNELVQGRDNELREFETDLQAARVSLEETGNAGMMDWFLNFIDDLGIGFGWGALYLTIIHAWWKGRSVGKKIFRIRVVMIDKRPLNLWLSFERVGGYAAGLATGMLGFAQIFWDPNRQAIHDKVSETIVIQDGKDAVPGPWMAE